MLLTPDREHHVLLATVQVCHWSAGRACLEIGRPQQLPRSLVERAELLPAEVGRGADVDLIADGRKEERPGRDDRGTRGIPERRQLEMRDKMTADERAKRIICRDVTILALAACRVATILQEE